MKKGLLIVSFGTSYRDSYERDILPVERALEDAFSERCAVCAYASTRIIRKVRTRDGIAMLSVTEGMETLLQAGCEDILVQPTFLIPGIEYERLRQTLEGFTSSLTCLRLGKPLLFDAGDFKAVAQGVADAYRLRQGSLILMGHGTDHEANEAYLRLQRTFDALGESVYIGTVESTPTISDILPILKPCEAVTVAPLLLVAGDHARNDMAGDCEDSWYSRLTRAGHRVDCILNGLGSHAFIRELLIAHGKNAAVL